LGFAVIRLSFLRVGSVTPSLSVRPSSVNVRVFTGFSSLSIAHAINNNHCPLVYRLGHCPSQLLSVTVRHWLLSSVFINNFQSSLHSPLSVWAWSVRLVVFVWSGSLSFGFIQWSVIGSTVHTTNSFGSTGSLLISSSGLSGHYPSGQLGHPIAWVNNWLQLGSQLPGSLSGWLGPGPSGYWVNRLPSLAFVSFLGYPVHWVGSAFVITGSGSTGWVSPSVQLVSLSGSVISVITTGSGLRHSPSLAGLHCHRPSFTVRVTGSITGLVGLAFNAGLSSVRPSLGWVLSAGLVCLVISSLIGSSGYFQWVFVQ